MHSINWCDDCSVLSVLENVLNELRENTVQLSNKGKTAHLSVIPRNMAKQPTVIKNKKGLQDITVGLFFAVSLCHISCLVVISLPPSTSLSYITLLQVNWTICSGTVALILILFPNECF